jgi:hypothetical protein
MKHKVKRIYFVGIGGPMHGTAVPDWIEHEAQS